MPTAAAGLDVGVVALRIVTVIPDLRRRRQLPRWHLARRGALLRHWGLLAIGGLLAAHGGKTARAFRREVRLVLLQTLEHGAAAHGNAGAELFGIGSTGPHLLRSGVQRRLARRRQLILVLPQAFQEMPVARLDTGAELLSIALAGLV